MKITYVSFLLPQYQRAVAFSTIRSVLLLGCLVVGFWANRLEAISSAPVDASQYLKEEGISSLKLSGPLVQGGLLIGKVDPAANIAVGGHQIFIDAEGRFAIGLDRDAPKELVLSVFNESEPIKISLPIQQRSYSIQRIEGVEQKYVEPNPEQVARSRRDVKRVVAARKYSGEDSRFMQGFRWPAIGPISGIFGSQRVYNGVPRRPHYGVDIAREIGAPVTAPAAGVVTLAEDLYFSGWTLIIDHGHFVSSSFLHLDKIHVQVGDFVEQGQLVGDIGNTGRVTGPHLDWRMNWTGGGGNVRIDPQLLVPPMPN